MGNYRRMLDSMSNETLREEEDHKRPVEKPKSMEALATDLAKPKQYLPTKDAQGFELQSLTSDEKRSEYLETQRNISVEEQNQWPQQLFTLESAALATSVPNNRRLGQRTHEIRDKWTSEARRNSRK
ncbi:hypothetical protein J7337_007661 [Fusarium musae]|uniref:Uncharacterized protein n=1 Tax=Fusarium musae TaxID=1042133 RepID=A0A9P8DH78_9HYPO|nr:hypothetical protein J7337_007661 [Fusarium musae]KAG9501954.1 hypothetical protein J7337_007661 [Fusarium musae]